MILSGLWSRLGEQVYFTKRCGLLQISRNETNLFDLSCPGSCIVGPAAGMPIGQIVALTGLDYFLSLSNSETM